MDCVLLVCDSEKGIAFFTEFLNQNSCYNILTASSGSEAKRMMIERDFSLCIINTSVKGQMDEELAISIAEKNICQVILVVREEILDEVTEKVEDFGIITVAKPIHRQLFWNALKLARVAQNRISRMQEENDRLLHKIEDMKLINRAKCVLISYFAMSEESAHKYIEKQAMDMRQSRKEVAETILKTYET